MLNRRTIQRANNGPKQLNRLPLRLIGAGSLAVAGLLGVLLDFLERILSILSSFGGMLRLRRIRAPPMPRAANREEEL